jgi:hypothetical protein
VRVVKNKTWHIWLPPLLQVMLLSLLYLKLDGESGGDMALNLFGIIFLLIITFSVAIATFSDAIRHKTFFLIGLALAWIVHFFVVSRLI